VRARGSGMMRHVATCVLPCVRVLYRRGIAACCLGSSPSLLAESTGAYASPATRVYKDATRCQPKYAPQPPRQPPHSDPHRTIAAHVYMPRMHINTAFIHEQTVLHQRFNMPQGNQYHTARV